MMLDWLIRRLGPQHRCPVCAHPVTRFLPLPPEFEAKAKRHGYAHFGRAETLNIAQYACPKCGASDRERLSALHLAEVLRGIPPRQRLLHFAPEAALSAMIRTTGRFDYRTADLVRNDVDDRVDISRMEIYPDGSFDAFICSHVLEHVADDHAALRELRRILTADGWGIVMAPVMTHLEDTLEDAEASTESERWRQFGQGDHVRLYAKTDFLRRMAMAGFQVAQRNISHFGASAFRQCGLAPRSVLYVVRHDQRH